MTSLQRLLAALLEVSWLSCRWVCVCRGIAVRIAFLHKTKETTSRTASAEPSSSSTGITEQNEGENNAKCADVC